MAYCIAAFIRLYACVYMIDALTQWVDTNESNTSAKIDNVRGALKRFSLCLCAQTCSQTYPLIMYVSKAHTLEIMSLVAKSAFTLKCLSFFSASLLSLIIPPFLHTLCYYYFSSALALCSL